VSPRAVYDSARRPKLASRLAIATSLLIIVTCVCQGAILVHRNLALVRNYLADRARTSAGRLAGDAELGVLSGDTAGLSLIAQHALRRNDVVWVRIVDRDGVALASAGTTKTASLPPIGTAGGVAGPIPVGTGHWEFQVPVTTIEIRPQREEMQLFDPAESASQAGARQPPQRIGTVAIGISLAPLETLRRETLATATGLTSIVMLLAIACATWFARAVTRPLQALAGATDALAQGNLGVRVEAKTDDEMGALAESFNAMADSIASTQAALEAHSRTLEDKVQERTQHLEDLNRDLVEANRLKSEFLATVSHELRTPLNVILGYAEMLFDGESLTDAQRDLVAGIDRYSRLQLSLITNVLDFARLSSGKISFHVERFTLTSLLEEVATLARGRMNTGGVDLDVRTPREAIELETDRIKLQEILRNLVDNAFKFTEHGSIEIAGEAGPKRDQVVITVRDTGCGIPAAELPRIFDPFRQVGEGSTRSTGGVGLGLSIVKQLVTALAGEITVRSEVGKGSVFAVTIPRHLSAEDLRSVA